jgi:dTDP-4-amino-4,6-dideoxygalactose transaminase
MADLAIMGGTPVRSAPYPAWPVFDEGDIEAVTAVLRSGNWGGFPYPGPASAAFARQFARLQGGGYPVLAMNGTITLEVALRAAGIGWGDEVIVPAYTFQATAAAPMAAGAIPVLVDVDPDTYCISPEAIEKAITPRTRAILPVHLGAQMADMDAVLEIAGRHNLVVVEDSAHAHGAKWRGQGAGTLGDFGSFSLQSSKILTTGEGGVLLARTLELAEAAASIINCGRPADAESRHYTMGANYRLPEIQAALGLAALERFPEQAAQREYLLGYAEACLGGIAGVRLLRHDPRHTTRSFYRFIFAIDPGMFGADHRTVCQALRAEGIPAGGGYPPVHRDPLFQPWISRLPVPSAFPEYFQYGQVSFPAAERAAEQEAVWVDESVFRAGPQGVDDLVAAVRKVRAHALALRQLASTTGG